MREPILIAAMTSKGFSVPKVPQPRQPWSGDPNPRIVQCRAHDSVSDGQDRIARGTRFSREAGSGNILEVEIEFLVSDPGLSRPATLPHPVLLPRSPRRASGCGWLVLASPWLAVMREPGTRGPVAVPRMMSVFAAMILTV